ncbi:TetR family transcriptional regulator [Corynebacterium poyangense]|uniref:TetR family transcriptional regulator n=1 Tax=Corynebacterium poyangense TaxID=2684405 RepID=A0A7H0SL84_9CORY|nr:TetR/AcrR family transcriptional regulator [Corynebacterium poyangense]QNQ89309.1 TetR family transcriptional regulator [Corynebacterium poyangense]
MARRSVGRPRLPVLDRKTIALAALDLADSEGDSAVTMIRLAKHLGVAPSALYNHVSGKDEVRLLIQDVVMSRVDDVGLKQVVAGEIALDEGLRQWAYSYRETFARYPGLVPLIATLPVGGAPATQAMYESVAAALAAAGVPMRQIMPVIVAFESFLFGSAMDVHAPADIFRSAPGDDEAVTPTLRQALDAQPRSSADHSPNPYANPPFEWGLKSLCEAVMKLVDGKE